MENSLIKLGLRKGKKINKREKKIKEKARMKFDGLEREGIIVSFYFHITFGPKF